MPGREGQRRLLLSGRARDAAPSGGNFGLQGVLRLLVPVALYGKRRARREHRKNASCHRVRAQNPLPQKAADSAERGGNSVRAGTRRLRRALRAHLVFCDRFFNAASGQWASGADSGDGPGASVFCRSVSRRLSASSCFLLFSAMVSLLSAIWASMYKTSTDRYVLTHPVRAISRNIQSVPVTWATTSPRRTDAAAPSQNSACEKNLTFFQCVQT